MIFGMNVRTLEKNVCFDKDPWILYSIDYVFQIIGFLALTLFKCNWMCNLDKHRMIRNTLWAYMSCHFIDNLQPLFKGTQTWQDISWWNIKYFKLWVLSILKRYCLKHSRKLLVTFRNLKRGIESFKQATIFFIVFFFFLPYFSCSPLDTAAVQRYI